MAKPIIISAPSATGKTTIRNAFIEKFPNMVEKVITATTRKPRDGEVNGVDYYFLTPEEFDKKIMDNEFIEYTNVYENMYGSLKSSIEDILKKGKYPVIILDVVGKNKFEKIYPDCYSAFILPGSIEEIEKRLRDRNTTEDDLKYRLSSVEEEIEESKNYDIIIDNSSDLDKSINEFISDMNKLLENNTIDKFTTVLESCSEVVLFTIIEGLVGMLFSINQGIKNKKMEITDELEQKVMEIKNSLLLCVQHTSRFGVKEPLVDYFEESVMGESDKGSYKTPSPEYDLWLNFWVSWKNSLSYDQWVDVDKAIVEDNENVPNLPKKKWNQ